MLFSQNLLHLTNRIVATLKSWKQREYLSYRKNVAFPTVFHSSFDRGHNITSFSSLNTFDHRLNKMISLWGLSWLNSFDWSATNFYFLEDLNFQFLHNHKNKILHLVSRRRLHSTVQVCNWLRSWGPASLHDLSLQPKQGPSGPSPGLNQEKNGLRTAHYQLNKYIRHASAVLQAGRLGSFLSSVTGLS